MNPPLEPPILKPKIPLIGHLLGILWHQSAYLEKLGKELQTPVATLPMLHRKIYLVVSSVLAREVFNAENLAFESRLVEPSRQDFRCSKKTVDILTEQYCRDDASGMQELALAMQDGLGKSNFTRLMLSSLNRFSFAINGMGQVTELDSLYSWVRKTIALATSRALFGVEDPLNKNHDLVDSLGNFNDGLLSLTIGFCPSIFAPRAYRARAALQAAFGNYYLNDHEHERDVSYLIKERAKTYREKGIDPMEIGKRELSILQLATADAINTAFWLLLFIACDPTVTHKIRTEIICAITPKTGRAGWDEASLNIAKLEDTCPMLVAAYKETERLVVSQVTTRRVVKDTVISDGECKYLLKAGAEVQVPAGLCHLSEEFWGEHADVFNFRRFYKRVTKGDAARRICKPDPACEAAQREVHRSEMQAFFPFGGGKHLCPGREYASVQILALIAPLIMGFDIQSQDGGFIQRPEMVRGCLGEAVSRPSKEGMRMGAKLIRRKEWQGVDWKYTSDKNAIR